MSGVQPAEDQVGVGHRDLIPPAVAHRPRVGPRALRPDAQRAVKFSPRHPRCGTGFLLLVMVIAVFLFAVVGKPSLPWLVLSRILGIPLIIGISYEIGIKWAGRHPNGFFARILLWPGIQLQRLTTREPTPDQLEVAAAALEEVMKMDELEHPPLKEVAAET